MCGDVREQKPMDAPVPLGKPVAPTMHKDTNLYHDLAMGRAVTGVLHLINQTCTKKQATCETAICRSEFSSAQMAIQQIMAMHTLGYLGVPIKGSTYLFRDNRSIVQSGTIPHSILKQ